MADDLHPLRPGERIPGDWFDGTVPQNIVAGECCRIDSSFCFKRYFSTRQPGLRLGTGVTLWRTMISVEPQGEIVIGDNCVIANASLVCAERLEIGRNVFIAGGVTIVDSDFHPLDPAVRLRDLVALSPVGDQRRRPAIETRPVYVGDDAWIGFNATICKGVRIGAGATVWPGSVVFADVPDDAVVRGNPAASFEADGA